MSVAHIRNKQLCTVEKKPNHLYCSLDSMTDMWEGPNFSDLRSDSVVTAVQKPRCLLPYYCLNAFIFVVLAHLGCVGQEAIKQMFGGDSK